MNKYYTPSIEEFCVGFECEGLYTDWGSQNWSGIEIDDIAKLVEVTQSFDKNPYDEFRVKYLDDSDIEELGFIYKAKTIDLWFEKEGIYLREDGHHLNNIKLQYGLHDNKLKITFCYVSGEEQIHFEGKVKNKSELFKLLKMLEIN